MYLFLGKMTAEELAEKLNKSEYPTWWGEFRDKIEDLCKDTDLVVVHALSDDLLYFHGAIKDALGAWNGTIVKLFNQRIMHKDHFDSIKWLNKEYNLGFDKLNVHTLKAIWCPDEDDHNLECQMSWLIKTSFKSVPFNILEDGNIFCRGCVFNVNDIK